MEFLLAMSYVLLMSIFIGTIIAFIVIIFIVSDKDEIDPVAYKVMMIMILISLLGIVGMYSQRDVAYQMVAREDVIVIPLYGKDSTVVDYQLIINNEK